MQTHSNTYKLLFLLLEICIIIIIIIYSVFCVVLYFYAQYKAIEHTCMYDGETFNRFFVRVK